MKKMIKRVYLQCRYIKLHIKIQRGANVSLDSTFEGRNIIYHDSVFRGSIGFGSYIGENCHISAAIGRFCCIANNVKTINGFHPISGYVSIHPCFYSKKKQAGFSFVNDDIYDEVRYAILDRKIAVDIGNDVWIGENVIILAGTHIGDGAVIAAGAVVTQDVPNYAVVGGVPAKFIKYRFTETIINQLVKSKWWEQPISWIKENVSLFSDVNKLAISLDNELKYN